MTKLAPLITAFLRDYMPRQRGYSPQSCETYALSFKLLFDFAAKRLGTRPSRLTIEDLDAPMIVAFLTHIEQERGNGDDQHSADSERKAAAIKFQIGNTLFGAHEDDSRVGTDPSTMTRDAQVSPFTGKQNLAPKKYAWNGRSK